MREGVDGGKNKGCAAQLWLQVVMSQSCSNTRSTWIGTCSVGAGICANASICMYMQVQMQIWGMMVGEFIDVKC